MSAHTKSHGGKQDGKGHSVDFSILKKASQDSGELGAKLLPKSQDSAEAVASAVKDNADTMTASALEDAQLTCEKNIEGFARWMDDMQDRLDAAIKHYQDTDKWSKDILEGVGD